MKSTLTSSSDGWVGTRKGMLLEMSDGKTYRVTKVVSGTQVEVGPYRWWHRAVPLWLLVLSGLAVAAGLYLGYYLSLE